MRQVPKLNIFTVVMSAELGNNLLAPLFTFVFFATNSPLFNSPTSMTQRSLLFGLCLSLYKFAEVLANTVITTLSDHFGRKMAMYATALGLLIAGSAGVTALTIHSPFLMITGLFLSNLLNTNKAVGPAIIGDISPVQSRIKDMASIQCVISLGACLGPIIGGQFANHSLILPVAYSLPFLMVAIIAVWSLILVHTCQETLVIQRQGLTIPVIKMLKGYWSLLQSTEIRWLFLLLILCQISWSSYYEFIPPTLKNIFHYSAPQVGWFVGLIAFWLIVAASVVIRYLMRFYDHRQLLWISAAAVLMGTIFSLFASENPLQPWSQTLLWLSPIPTAMGDVIFFSLFTAFLSHRAPANQQGKAMGLTLIIANLVWSATALMGGYLLTLHPNGALLFAPCGALALLLVLIFCKGSLFSINQPQEALS